MENKNFNGDKGLANHYEGFVELNLEPISKEEMARLMEEQKIQHFTNILKYLRYKSASVKDTDMGVTISSVNTEGKDWFYCVENTKTGEMITYWCYNDEIAGEVDEPEVCARGMWEYMTA